MMPYGRRGTAAPTCHQGKRSGCFCRHIVPGRGFSPACWSQGDTDPAGASPCFLTGAVFSATADSFLTSESTYFQRSLTATSEAKLSQSLNITRAYPIEKVFAAIDDHLKVTNHKVFISYVLMKDINDSVDHATALADLIRQTSDRLRLCHINLIRYNSGPSLTTYQRPDRDKIDRFMEVLENNRVHHTLRQDFGLKIDAACGQLAAKLTIPDPLIKSK